ncbi:MAG: extracellular solute-binding protein [Planctomycetaceae bacterium]|nr:extracellular solute-binding protein [Planctomycetaceae bacterium]
MLIPVYFLQSNQEIDMRWPSLLLCVTLAGCWASGPQEVVVYTALDSEFSVPSFDRFTAATGITVLPKFDAESTKTIGLAEAIIAERARPRCDVFWNNEILHTLRLKRLGLLDVYIPPAAKNFPLACRDPKAFWHGFAARARVLVVNTALVPEKERPASIHALASPKWKGRAAIAKPLFGTTATHAACLFAAWGDQRAKDFFHALKRNNVQVLSGNKQVALSVAAGRVAFGVTDTDDALIELQKGRPIAIVWPDQGPNDSGTLLIPNTLAIVHGGPHREAARRLVDYLLSPEVETRLAEGPSGQIPLNPKLIPPPQLPMPRPLKTMTVDFDAAAKKWDAASEFLRAEFTGP